MSDHLGQVLLPLRKGRMDSDFVFSRKDGNRILCLEEEFNGAFKKAAFTARAFAEADRKTAEWLKRVRGFLLRSNPGRFYRSFWNKRNRAAGLEI